MRWLDAAEQARLARLTFSPRRPAPALAPGRHRTPARGFSRDFSQHRPYSSGDEARAIDWKAYARLDRYYVREYRAEDRAALVVLLDATASMTFAAGGRAPKLDLACRAAAALGWLALSQGDEAGLVPLGAASGPEVPVRAGASQLPAFDEALSAVVPGRDEGFVAAVAAAAARLPRRAAVAVVSDLMGDAAEILKALRRLSAGRRELLVLRVLDPEERDFPYEGPLVIEGLEGGTLALDASSVAAAYREAFARQDEAYRASLSRAGIPYAVAATDAPWDAALARLLA